MSVFTAWRAATSTDIVPPLPCMTSSSRAVALRAELAGQPAQIAVDDRLHEAVDGGGRAALELAVLRQELGADRDVRVRPHGRRDLARAPLVRVVDVGVDEVDDERFDAAPRAASRRRGAPRPRRAAPPPAPSASMRSVTSSRSSRGISASNVPLRPYGVGRVRRPSSSTSRKPARRDEPGPRALALEQRVRRRRRAVDEDLDRRRRDASVAQRDEHALRLIADRRRHLGDARPSRSPRP